MELVKNKKQTGPCFGGTLVQARARGKEGKQRQKIRVYRYIDRYIKRQLDRQGARYIDRYVERERDRGRANARA